MLLPGFDFFEMRISSFLDDLTNDILNRRTAANRVNMRNNHFKANSAHFIVYDRWYNKEYIFSGTSGPEFCNEEETMKNRKVMQVSKTPKWEKDSKNFQQNNLAMYKSYIEWNSKCHFNQNRVIILHINP